MLELRAFDLAPRIDAVGKSVAWSPALEVAGNPDCDACRGRRLHKLSFCLGCCRSRLDGVLPKVKATDRPRMALQSDPDGLAGGKGRKFAAAG